jgi:hypothetical protein
MSANAVEGARQRRPARSFPDDAQSFADRDLGQSQIYFDKAHCRKPLANRLIRLAAFQNPEFYKAQAMRLPVWDKPRIIGCAENFPRHIALPRGLPR